MTFCLKTFPEDGNLFRIFRFSVFRFIPVYSGPEYLPPLNKCGPDLRSKGGEGGEVRTTLWAAAAWHSACCVALSNKSGGRYSGTASPVFRDFIPVYSGLFRSIPDIPGFYSGYSGILFRIFRCHFLHILTKGT